MFNTKRIIIEKGIVNMAYDKERDIEIFVECLMRSSIFFEERNILM